MFALCSLVSGCGSFKRRGCQDGGLEGLLPRCLKLLLWVVGFSPLPLSFLKRWRQFLGEKSKVVWDSSAPITASPCAFLLHLRFSFLLFQVMETKDMLYIVTEFAKNGEMFGELSSS